MIKRLERREKKNVQLLACCWELRLTRWERIAHIRVIKIQSVRVCLSVYRQSTNAWSGSRTGSVEILRIIRHMRSVEFTLAFIFQFLMFRVYVIRLDAFIFLFSFRFFSVSVFLLIWLIFLLFQFDFIMLIWVQRCQLYAQHTHTHKRILEEAYAYSRHLTTITM